MFYQTYRVTTIDLPGLGMSPWQPQIKTMHDFADTLLPYMPTKAIYIGWSLGGQLAMSIAVRYPERVKQLIGIGTTPKFIETTDWPGFPQPGFKILPLLNDRESFQAFAQIFCDNEYVTVEPKPTSYNEVLKISTEVTLKTNMDVLAAGFDIVDACDFRNEFKTLQCPIDLIVGERDMTPPLVSHEKIKQLNHRAKIHCIKDAAHMPFWTHPEEFNTLLKNIMGRK